jgi:CHAT domain-containing protein
LQGQAGVALAECERAVASIEQVQSRLAPELRSHFLDDKVQVFREAVDTALIAAGPQRALDYLERAKSRALVDYLAINSEVAFRTRNEAGRDLVDELARLRDEHHWLSNRLNGYGLSQTGEQPLKPAEVPALQEALRERESRIARLLEQVTLQDADRVEGRAGAVPLSAGPPDLAAGTVLLEYFLHEDGGVVFVVRDGEVVAVPLESGTGEVQHHLFRWQLSLDASASALVLGQPLAALQRNALGVLQRLYRVLLAPVEAHLRGARQIVVVPYGAGHAVPWHALHDGSCYLVERAEVWSCPSSSLLSMLEKRLRTASGRPVVFAHGQHGALPHVQREAESVASALGADVFSGEAATRRALRSAASGCKVLHLAAHGEARLDDPTFAHLQLADGQLAAADVFGLSLDGALVTLSACETGRTVVTGGDELIGLSRGFLFAGASTLVQSLWRVEDESTAQLMTRFYQALADGRGAAEALRIAQLALLEERDGLPYFWAPFQVVGHGDWSLEPS